MPPPAVCCVEGFGNDGPPIHQSSVARPSANEKAECFVPTNESRRNPCSSYTSVVSGCFIRAHILNPQQRSSGQPNSPLLSMMIMPNSQNDEEGLIGLFVTCNMGPIVIYTNHKSSTISGELCVQLHGQSKTYSSQVCPKPVLQLLHPLPLNYQFPNSSFSHPWP